MLQKKRALFLPFFTVYFALLGLGYSQDTLPTPECSEPEFEDNQLIRTGPNSKFLYPKNLYFTSSEEATSLCESLHLKSAKVNGKWEYKHLVDFVYEMNLNNTEPNFKVNLGTFRNEQGHFQYLDRQPPHNQLKHQAFNLQSGEYFTDGLDCLAIEWFQTSHYFVPIPCDKSADVMPLCQYKPEEFCSVNSPLTIQDEDKQLNNLFKVGESKKYVYYGAYKQRSWHDALQYCKANSLTLVSFHKEQPELIMEILNFINEYKNTLETKMWLGFSWTSGRFQNDTSFIFDLASEPWDINEMVDYMKWNDKQTVDRQKESCIVVTANGLRPVVCELPNYFLCFALKNLTSEFPTILTITPETARKLQKREQMQNSKPARSLDIDIDLFSPKSSTQSRTDIKSDQNTEPTQLPECEKLHSINFTSHGLTSTEIIGLIKTSISLNFSTGLSDLLPVNEKSRWRVPHVMEMGELTKLVCPEKHVKHTFVNKLLNYIMVYYNSVEEQIIPPTRIKFWEKLKEKYSSCKNTNTTTLILSSTGGLITAFDGDGRTGNVIVVNEKADVIPTLDPILEGFWHMFEITAGTCYKSGDAGSLWLSEYFTYFRKDFTDQFKLQWVDPGNTNYGALFGDLDIHESLYNLRACSVANFQRLDIEDLLLVRPVEVGSDTYLSKSLNQRT